MFQKKMDPGTSLLKWYRPGYAERQVFSLSFVFLMPWFCPTAAPECGDRTWEPIGREIAGVVTGPHFCIGSWPMTLELES